MKTAMALFVALALPVVGSVDHASAGTDRAGLDRRRDALQRHVLRHRNAVRLAALASACRRRRGPVSLVRILLIPVPARNVISRFPSRCPRGRRVDGELGAPLAFRGGQDRHRHAFGILPRHPRLSGRDGQQFGAHSTSVWNWEITWEVSNTGSSAHTFAAGDQIRVFSPGGVVPLATASLAGYTVPAHFTRSGPLPLAGLAPESLHGRDDVDRPGDERRHLRASRHPVRGPGRHPASRRARLPSGRMLPVFAQPQAVSSVFGSHLCVLHRARAGSHSDAGRRSLPLGLRRRGHRLAPDGHRRPSHLECGRGGPLQHGVPHANLYVGRSSASRTRGPRSRACPSVPGRSPTSPWRASSASPRARIWSSSEAAPSLRGEPPRSCRYRGDTVAREGSISLWSITSSASACASSCASETADWRSRLAVSVSAPGSARRKAARPLPESFASRRRRSSGSPGLSRRGIPRRPGARRELRDDALLFLHQVRDDVPHALHARVRSPLPFGTGHVPDEAHEGKVRALDLLEKVLNELIGHRNGDGLGNRARGTRVIQDYSARRQGTLSRGESTPGSPISVRVIRKYRNQSRKVANTGYRELQGRLRMEISHEGSPDES